MLPNQSLKLTLQPRLGFYSKVEKREHNIRQRKSERNHEKYFRGRDKTLQRSLVPVR